MKGKASGARHAGVQDNTDKEATVHARTYVPSVCHRREDRTDGRALSVVVRISARSAAAVVRDASASGMAISMPESASPRTGETFEIAAPGAPVVVCRVVRLTRQPGGDCLIGCRRVSRNAALDAARRPPRLRHWLRDSVR